MEKEIGIKSIRKIQTSNSEKIYCVQVDDPHEIVIKPNDSVTAYSISNCNFSLLFGASYKRFSQLVLETSWSEERVKQFVKDNKLEADVNIMADKHPQEKSIIWYYYASANFIRNNFFDTYKGLMERIKRNELLGKTQGYIRSVQGAIRRVPLLSLATDEEGKWRKNENLKEMANLVNICANTSIQSDEICSVAKAMTEWDAKYKDISPLCGTVHDSVDMFMLKGNEKEQLIELRKIFEKEEDWQLGVKMLIDITVADLTNEDHYYKHGYSDKYFFK